MDRCGDAAARSAAVRHGIGRLCRRPVRTALAATAADTHPRAALVAVAALRLLRGGERRARRGDEPRRRGLLPLHAEALHCRRDPLRRQRQLVRAGPEVRRGELVPRARGRAAHRPAGPRLRPPPAGDAPAARGVEPLRRLDAAVRAGHRALHRRHAGRLHAHDASDHALQRRALRPGQRPGEPHPEQPLLHPAHRGRRREGPHAALLRAGAACTALHPRARARRQRRGRPHGTQHRAFRPREHVGRALGTPLPGNMVGYRRGGGE